MTSARGGAEATSRAETGKSLKDQYRWQLWIIVAVNTLFLYGVAQTNAIKVDGLRAILTDGRQTIAAMEDRERKRTGIASLKIRYNQVFGYYIEISKPNLSLVPADYDRKQTLVNAERFTSSELAGYERKVLSAEERATLYHLLVRAAGIESPRCDATDEEAPDPTC